ncbi:helix-hairpin-helix domain-containing protein [Alkalihalobacillus sp. CinArs1]|uniref:helix-hairpin-helix domain-containing protein n=1 Tax=Alkalihalobacillus sp. CinArs1 TaxID=2995314 RepID=UPI0022DD75CB|nr:helix-hairpin-helix domain-containing protein [Alkalihalobacillus sp. CinArs1]
MKSLSHREKGIIGIAIVVVLISLFLIYRSTSTENESYFEETEIKEEKVEAEPQVEELPYIMVDVKGAVVKPGVYEVKNDARIKDIITHAGGFLKDADQNQLNLAGKVVDEMMIYVPVKGEVSAQIPSQNDENKLISINSASLEELQELPGIGPAKAEAIIAFREEQSFTVIEDLKQISGIGEKTFEKLKDLITVK